MNKNINVISHPLVNHCLNTLRMKSTQTGEFRKRVHELSILLLYEATKNLKTIKQNIETPIAPMQAEFLQDKHPVVIPILRAGLAMLDGFLVLFPEASIGFAGLQRNEKTLAAEEYYFKIPKDTSHHPVYIIDPMLATGGTAVGCVNHLKAEGISNITFVCIIAAPEGIENFSTQHPDIPLFVASIDRQLNQHRFIIPGLGDAGDRLYGTE